MSTKPIKASFSEKNRELLERISNAELQAKDFETQARIYEARIRLIELQRKYRELTAPANKE